MCRAAVGQIITVDRSDDYMAQAQAVNGLCYVQGFCGIKVFWNTGPDITEGTGTGAGIAHDHHGGVSLAPAFINVGTRRLFTNRVQIQFPH